ncbi:glycoside hydrolase family 17 protein [Sphaerobolus stellatus SS14]|uniref:glucan endo-1,3-beta-D-glucosidase n=1 Tax=Sphaerobolus stellatus (strain SS14) TaxID=990650 RepID=A0A0C9UBA8_SPHS4|nr:glycoside hydrolase family 17 protein [Sphaerobolus stellatus SS14]
MFVKGLVLVTFFTQLYENFLGANNFAGIVASNSVGGSSSYKCRTQAQWNQLAKDSKAAGFKTIRIEGFECNALEMVSTAAAANNLQVLAGIYASKGTIDASLPQINNDVQTFRAAYKKFGAKRYVGLTIGNEVNDSVGKIMAKVYDVRGYLRSVGVTTPVSTAHIWVNIRDSPALCGADFVAANAHAFFDGNVKSAQAGDFIFNTVVPSLKKACPGKRIMISESGWPSRGNPNRAAKTSLNDEKAALASLNCASKRDKNVMVFAFEYDDQTWKSNDNERSFGIFGKNINLNDIFKPC